MPSLNRHILNSTAWAVFIQTLAEDGGTLQDLAQESGLSIWTISKVLRSLHKRGAIHVASWDNDTLGRPSVRLWKLGRAKDAKRPARKSNTQKCRDYYEKQRQVAAATGCDVKAARVAGTRRNMFGVLEVI